MFVVYTAEVKNILIPYLKLIGSKYDEDFSTKYLKMKLNILLRYCNNISYYMILKSQNKPIASHPVIKRLAKMKELVAQVEKDQGDLLEKVKILLESQNAGKPLYEIQATEKESQLHKESKFTDEESQSENGDMLDEDVDMEEVGAFMKSKSEMALDEDEEEGEEEEEEEKRYVNKEIALNKGIVPHRKKEQRNPRVKHRNKYRKALKNRRGAVSYSFCHFLYHVCLYA